MKEFETQHFRMKISDEFIKEVLVKKNVSFSPENYKESISLSNSVCKPGTKFYVLLEGEEGAQVPAETRRLAASQEYSNHSSALALCSSNLLMAIAGNLFLKINKPKVPTRFFENRDEAIIWLKKLMANSQI